ncbi:MAG: fibronectin type III domain-containing protein [Thermoanaerobaculia bacterium]
MTARLPRWLALAMLLAAPPAGAQTPPSPPTRLAAVTLTPTEVKLTWRARAVEGTEVRVELRTLDGAFEDVGAVPGLSRAALVQGLQPATGYVFRVRAARPGTFSEYSNEAAVTTSAVPGPCVADAQTLCVGGRFRARAEWKAPDGRAGVASVQPVPSGSSGLLWFVSPDSLELLVKVLDGCAGNGHYWVFVGPATNLQYLLTVTDTRTGQARAYFNPQGVSPQAVTDTYAFEGCP